MATLEIAERRKEYEYLQCRLKKWKGCSAYSLPSRYCRDCDKTLVNSGKLLLGKV